MKIGFITISDNTNLGNRLQCFAVYKVLSAYGECTNIINYHPGPYYKQTFLIKLIRESLLLFKRILRFLLKHNEWKKIKERKKNFNLFNKNIPVIYKLNPKNMGIINDYYDFVGTGSDQVWNPKFSRVGMFYNMLGFIADGKKFAISPSIAIDKLDEIEEQEFKKYLSSFRYLSCREKDGSTLLELLLQKKCETLIDPTMLLSMNDWRKVEKPINNIPKHEFVLVYFLGGKTDEVVSFISQVSTRYGLDVVDIYEKNSSFYSVGPSEFLYLIDRCKVVITDSFHGVVFANIFKKPFRQFSRKGSKYSMNSRLDNLYDTLNINKEVYSNNYIISSLFSCVECEEILNREKQRFYCYLDKVFK